MDATGNAPVWSLCMLPVMGSHAAYTYLVRLVGAVDGAGMSLAAWAMIVCVFSRASLMTRCGIDYVDDEACCGGGGDGAIICSTSIGSIGIKCVVVEFGVVGVCVGIGGCWLLCDGMTWTGAMELVGRIILVDLRLLRFA